MNVDESPGPAQVVSDGLLPPPCRESTCWPAVKQGNLYRWYRWYQCCRRAQATTVVKVEPIHMIGKSDYWRPREN